MKASLFLVVLALAALSSHATIRTVCNSIAYTPGQFTSLNAALAASVANDTIYVHGSPIPYGSATINLSGIVVIGTGHSPNKQTPVTTVFGTITINANNVQLIGLTLDNVLSTASAATVKRCKFVSTSLGGIAIQVAANGWLVEGNVFMNPAFSNVHFGSNSTTNAILRNNVFAGNIGSNSTLSPSNGLIIANNLFLGVQTFTFQVLFKALIINNIFYRASPQGTSDSSMSNNISYLCSNNNFSSPGANNLVDTNPLFTTFPAPGALFDYTHDYHLAAGSPGIGNGSDATDRGIYGGLGTRFTMTGEPPIAEITAFTITSPTTIAPGGTLTISVTSKRIQ